MQPLMSETQQREDADFAITAMVVKHNSRHRRHCDGQVPRATVHRSAHDQALLAHSVQAPVGQLSVAHLYGG